MSEEAKPAEPAKPKGGLKKESIWEIYYPTRLNEDRDAVLDALFGGVLRLAQAVAQEFEAVFPVDVADREEVSEYSFQRDILPVAVDADHVEAQTRCQVSR